MTNDPTDDPIDYDQWIEDALRTVAVRALTFAEQQGLPGEHHFYITFKTAAEGVQIPAFLRAQYPEEMTIVLQHQFEDLEVVGDAFRVTLRFGGRPATLNVPFSAMTAFTDPSVKFGLQYSKAVNTEKPAESVEKTQAAEPGPVPSPADGPKEAEGAESEKRGEVIALDSFRKK